MLSHKELLADRGFLVYVMQTFPAMVPYLKGFHLTIEMWRGGRDAEGWKLPKPGVKETKTEEESEEDVDGQVCFDFMVDPGVGGGCVPKDGITMAVPRLRDYVEALMRLSNFEDPPLRVVRPVQVVQVFYGFGDASGKQLGATLSGNLNCRECFSAPRSDPGGVCFRIGMWLAAKEEKSSNFKELKNLVDTVREEASTGRIKDCELFM